MYDPSIGRWLTPDPIEFEGGEVNLYRFVGNNALNSTDPSGLIDPKNLTGGESHPLLGGKFDFEGGTGQVEVFTKIAHKLNSLKDLIRLKFTASVSVDNAHWLQIYRMRSFNVVDNTENLARVDPPYDFTTECDSGRWVSSNIAAAGAGGLVATTMNGRGRTYSLAQRIGEWKLDTNSDNNSFYDQSGGLSVRNGKDVSILDQPIPHEGLVTKDKYIIFEAKNYLVANGRPYYEVEWSLRIDFNPSAPSGGPVVSRC